MRDPVMSLLREAVRAEISNAFEVIGHARPREVARVVCALHPSDVLSIGARLAEDALTDIARRELKRRPSKNERAQITLPGIPDALSKGTIAGCVIPWEVVPAVKVNELTKYHAEFDPAGRTWATPMA